MSQGVRLALIRQAQLTWSQDADFQEFLETGRLGSEEQSEVIPYDPHIRKQVIQQFQGG